MGDTHQMIIDYVGKIIGWKAIGLQQYLVVQMGMVDADFTIDMVKKTADARFRDALPDDRQNPQFKFSFDFFIAQIAAWVAIALHALPGDFQGRFVFFLAETVISVPTLDQFMGVFLVDR